MDEQTIFTMAIEKKTPPERAAFLDRACGDNAELRRGVDLLLKAHEKAGSFLESPPAVIAPTLDPPAEKLGTHIDRYKLDTAAWAWFIWRFRRRRSSAKSL